jgi:hypothetical protein
MENLTELILLQIKGITKDIGGFVAGLLSDDLTHDQQINFGHRLVDLAELILERAKNPAMVIEGNLSDDGEDNPTEHSAAIAERASTLAI